MDELAFAGPGALAGRVRAGEVHPRELVELCLRRIEALDPALNAFRTTWPERALEDAEQPKQGPLAGVPVAVKDDLAVAGQAATWGTRARSVRQPADAEAVRRLRAAGAIPIGITHVPELMAFPWTATSTNGITRNPWDPSRTPGGSSGGSAAAARGGLVPAATGSDGGGSIRIPAACCGLVGMKPSRGRVSTQPAAEGWLGLSVYGALARTVADSALLLDVMAGAVDGDRDRLPAPEPSFTAQAQLPPRPLRIAISAKLPPGILGRISPGQRGAFERTARRLEELGHHVSERDPAYGLIGIEFTRTYLRAISEDVATLAADAPLSKQTRQLARLGRRLLSARRRDQLRARRPATTARILALWDECDVLLTPGLARTALPAEGGFGMPALRALDLAARFTPFTPPFNLTGQPAVALPAGWDADGLPLSVQLVGRPGEEGLLYSLAAQLEAAAPWSQRVPDLASPAVSA